MPVGDFSIAVWTGKTLAYGFSNEGFVPDNDYAGIVEEVGSNVKKVKKGDRVRRTTSSQKLMILLTCT